MTNFLLHGRGEHAVSFAKSLQPLPLPVGRVSRLETAVHVFSWPYMCVHALCPLHFLDVHSLSVN